MYLLCTAECKRCAHVFAVKLFYNITGFHAFLKKDVPNCMLGKIDGRRTPLPHWPQRRRLITAAYARPDFTRRPKQEAPFGEALKLEAAIRYAETPLHTEKGGTE